jgi:pyruvate dehydrogenase E2 component (dihydrolipoamide acetyltransferase)
MQIIMPKLGLTMTQGSITEWLKVEGDTAKAEEALCIYETEKVTLELVAPEDGVLAQILAPAGATVPAGAPVCEFLTSSEAMGARGAGQGIGSRMPEPAALADRSATALHSLRAPAGSQQRASGGGVNATPKARELARQQGIALAGIAGSGPDGRVQAQDVLAARPAAPASVRATPLARRMAAAEGIDLRVVVGTGPEGTVTRDDIEALVKGQGLTPSGQRDEGREPARATTAPLPDALQGPSIRSTEQIIRHTALRRTIAERMSQSALTAPHVTLMAEAEATNLVAARMQLNQELPDAEKISYNTLLAALVARALREHPGVNARWEPDGIHLLPEINIALAVDTERGLMTPVLHAVDRLSLPAIQRGYATLAGRALAGKSLPDDLSGGTFTLTNLGALDIDGFTPLINPPQAAILGLGRIVEKPVAREGAVVIRPMMTLSLSFDHRVVDGAPAARFLQRVKQLVERPMALLLRDA